MAHIWHTGKIGEQWGIDVKAHYDWISEGYIGVGKTWARWAQNPTSALWRSMAEGRRGTYFLALECLMALAME